MKCPAKTRRINIRVSEEEYKMFVLASGTLGESVSAYIRQLVRMSVAPMKLTLKEKGVSVDEALQQLHISLDELEQ